MEESKVVYAPAVIGNVGPHFDISGLALYGLGDVVKASKTDKFKGAKLVEIVNNPGLPFGQENVVQTAGKKVLEVSGEDLGIELILYKFMRKGTGLGSSASSSVAGALAVNNVLGQPFNKTDEKIIDAILSGEEVATGARPPDNVFPSLLGGFVCTYDQKRYSYRKFDGWDSLYFAVVSPDLEVKTRDTRAALKSAPYDLPTLVKTASNILKTYINLRDFHNWDYDSETFVETWDLSTIVTEGCSKRTVHKYIRGAIDVIRGIWNQDIEMLGNGIMSDDIITPIRAKFITGYEEVKRVALKAGAYGFCISGSGPSVFSITNSKEKAHNIGDAMQKAFREREINSRLHVSLINKEGARVISQEELNKMLKEYTPTPGSS